MAQQTLMGGITTSTQIQKDNSKHDFKTQQLEIGVSKEDIIKQREEEKKCLHCNQVKPKYYDICNGERNETLCVDCIRKRHEKHGLNGPGYLIDGNVAHFYSQTTEMEVRPLADIYKVFIGVCFPNPVFPYCLNCKDEKYGNNCFGITQEFGDFLKESGVRGE